MTATTSKQTHSGRSLQRLVRPLVVCHHCKGTGKLHLSDDMQATLDAVKIFDEAGVADVARVLKWKGHMTAINNRLEDLRTYGLLERKRYGREWFYRPNR